MKKIKVIVLIILALSFQGCVNRPEKLFIIDDFLSIWQSMSNVDTIIPPQPPFDEAYAIDGFRPLNNFVFDAASDFGTNSQSFVSLKGKNYAMSNHGELKNIQEIPKDVNYDKTVVSFNGLEGVMNIDGDVIIQPKYLSVEIFEDLILGFEPTGVSVFKGGKKTVFLNHVDFDTLSIFSKDFILIDGKVCDIYGKKQMQAGFEVVFPEVEGFLLIKDNRGKVGYATARGDVAIAPYLYEASVFKDGYAYIREKEDSDYILIDVNLNRLHGFKGKPKGIYDQYIAVVADSETSIYDGKYEDTGLKFSEILNNRVYGNTICFYSKDFGFYSLKSGHYFKQRFNEVYYNNGFFICAGNLLLDEELNTILSAEEISYEGRILKVKNEDGYRFYERDDNG